MGVIPVQRDILALLGERRNPDGGFGAGPGMPSQTEATSLAALALAGDPAEAEAWASAVAWLVASQRPDGAWPVTAAAPEPSWATSLAVLALTHAEGQREPALEGMRWLLAQEARTTPRLRALLKRIFTGRSLVEQDGELRGWSWTPGSFSWVEPTAYALIALKNWRGEHGDPRLETRIREAERMIYDRMCVGGGWNYGNSVVLGEELWPYPDVTAVALLALQDHAATEATRRSLRALRPMLESHDSGLALSWSVLCLQLYRRPVDDLRARLERAFRARGFLGETRCLALAALALGDGAERFRVPG